MMGTLNVKRVETDAFGDPKYSIFAQFTDKKLPEKHNQICDFFYCNEGVVVRILLNTVMELFCQAS